MNIGSLITMIIVLCLIFGGLLYFLNIAFTSEGKRKE
ncbi:MAG: MetS family NSS transporter small subunit [Thermoanaerobacteraceae bacterium]|nr:MetS family NSS transporter small subunit [Thermoanaerobacteraceae bacterium]